MPFQHQLRGKFAFRQNIDVDEDMKTEILAYAAREGVSVAEAVRTLIQWGLDALEE